MTFSMMDVKWKPASFYASFSIFLLPSLIGHNRKVSLLLTAVGFSTRALVQCANRDGMSVRSLDCCGDRDTLELSCASQLIELSELSWIKSLEPSTRVMLAGGMEDSAEALELLSQVDATIIPEQYRQMRDWRNWRRWSLGSGIKFPSTYPIEDWPGAQVAQAIGPTYHAIQANQKWLWKKQRSAGGLGVKFIDSENLPDPSLLRANFSFESGVLQEYVTGKSIGVSFLSSHHGTVILGMAESIPLQPHIWSDFIYRGSIGPVGIPDWLKSLIHKFANFVTSSTGWCGLWQADFMLSERELYLIEINPRWTASMELIACGYDLPLVTWHVESPHVALSDWTSMQSIINASQDKSHSRFRKEIRYADEDRIVSSDEHETWWQSRWIARERDESGVWFADIPRPHTSLHKNAPVYSVIELIG